MPIEIIGTFSHRDSAEHRQAPLSRFDTSFLRDLVQAYDRNGYDRMLIANGATWPDSIPFAAYIAAITERVGWMIAHRPGFVAPTMAARMLATIDQLSHGRAAVHIITGANDAEMESDGDFLAKEMRYRRSGEYVDVLRRMWSSDEPFDHEGSFYRFNRGYAEVKPVQRPGIPVYWGGQSPAAIEVGARCADVYATGIDAVANVGDLVARFRTEAARHGRSPRFCLSARLIVGETEEAAWETAHEIRDSLVAQLDRSVRTAGAKIGMNVAPTGRMQQMIDEDAVLDKRLWTGILRATQGTRGAVALVGTAEQIVDSLLDYYDLGITSFLISGFDFRVDPDVFGRELIPMLRAGAQARAPRQAYAT